MRDDTGWSRRLVPDLVSPWGRTRELLASMTWLGCLKRDSQIRRERSSRTPLPSLRITVYRSVSDVEDVWRRAAEQFAFYLFQSFEWLSLWYAKIGAAEGIEPCIVHVSDLEERTLFLLPFGIMRRFAIRTLVFMGGSSTDYNAPLISHGFFERYGPDQFAGLWAAIKIQLPKVDFVWLRRMPEVIGDAPNPMTLWPIAVHAGNAYAASPLPASFSEFTAARSTGYFADTRRQRRRIAKLGDIALDIPDHEEEIVDVVRRMFRQKERRFHETGSQKPNPRKIAFLEAFATLPLSGGRAHVSRLRVGNDIVATHVGAVFRNRFYYLMPGYEAGKWTQLSVGRVLQEELVKWCIDQKLECFDMTTGDEPYKRYWTNTTLRLYECMCATNAKGVLALVAVRLRDRAQRDQNVRRLLMPLRRWLLVSIHSAKRRKSRS